MKFINKTKILSFLPQIFAMLFLVGFVAYAWTEPGVNVIPPDDNVPAPINVGPNTQTKQGDITFSGNLQVNGDIIDKAGNIIYNAITNKIERARLPF